ncbi:Senecionine N-oxygenase [Tilletia horrida]|nr:Senecionine N-oxygenase [Tilletia horrida]
MDAYDFASTSAQGSVDTHCNTSVGTTAGTGTGTGSAGSGSGSVASASGSGPASPTLPPLSAAALALAPPPPLETLPIANISRIMRRSLPESAKIGKDAKDAVQIVLSEFISFVTSEANERCLADRRKTISGDDLLTAFRLLGLDEYHEVLRIFLTRYRMVRGVRVHVCAVCSEDSQSAAPIDQAQEANPRPKRKRGGAKAKAGAEGRGGGAPEEEGVVELDEEDEEEEEE